MRLESRPSYILALCADFDVLGGRGSLVHYCRQPTLVFSSLVRYFQWFSPTFSGFVRCIGLNIVAGNFVRCGEAMLLFSFVRHR